MRRTFALCLALGALGCAGGYYESFRAENPDWAGDFPTRGASLHEVLAGLYAPPVADYHRFVSKLCVLRLGADGTATPLDEAEIDAALRAAGGADYGVVATVGCRSEYNRQVFQGEKVAWLLLPGGRLAAWDVYDYVDRCTVANDFAPARSESAPLERALVAYRDANFPRSMEHVGELYAKGLRYLDAGRRDDAAAMLRAGDAAFDVGSRASGTWTSRARRPRFARPTARGSNASARSSCAGSARRRRRGTTTPARGEGSRPPRPIGA